MLPTVGTEFSSLDEAKLAVFERCGNARYRMGTTQSTPGKYIHLHCSIRIHYSELCSCRVVIKEVEGSDPVVFRVVESVEQHTCSKDTRKQWREKAGDVMRKSIERVKKTMEEKKQIGCARMGQASRDEYDSEPSGDEGAQVGLASERKRRRRDSVKQQIGDDEGDSAAPRSETSSPSPQKRRTDLEPPLYPSASQVFHEIVELVAGNTLVSLPSPSDTFDSPTPIFVRAYAFSKQHNFTVYRKSPATDIEHFTLCCSRGHSRFREAPGGLCPFTIRGAKGQDRKWRFTSSGLTHNHSIQYPTPFTPAIAPPLPSTSYRQTTSTSTLVPPPSHSDTFRIPSQPIHRPHVPSYTLSSTSQPTESFEPKLLLNSSVRPQPSSVTNPRIEMDEAEVKRAWENALLLALAPLFDMTVNGLWPAINACVEPALVKVTNRIATAAHYLFSQIAQRQAVQNPPAPPPRRTDPQDSEDENDDGMNGGLEGDDGQEQSPPPAQPFAPVASTSDLNRQPPFRAPSPASSLSSLPSSKSSHTEDDPPEVPPLPPPTPPTHHIFEVAPYEEAEKTAMLAHPVTSSQPLEKFMDQLLIQVLIRLMLVQEDWGRQFPNIRIGWIFEGDSTKEKEQKLKERVKKEGEAQVKGDWKEQQRERIKARRAKKRLKKAESISRKRIAQNGGVGDGGGDEMDEEEEDCEQGLDEGGEEVDEKEDIGPPDGSRRLRSSEIPRLKAPKKVEPIDCSLLSADSQFVHCLLTHVRYLQAIGEAEHAITPAALINSWILTPEQKIHISYVSYADGADPSIFPLPPLQVLSHSPDGDQASLFTEHVVGWIVNNPNFNVLNFERLAIETPPGTPQHLRLPNDKKKTVPSIRIVNSRDLFFDKRIYPLPTIECRATMPVYTGNDYVVGGHRIGYGTFRNGKHARLMEISCKPNLRHEITPALDSEYRRLLRALPPSDYIASLTLSSFLKKRQTNRAIDIETFNKQDFYAAHLGDVKREMNDAREARRLQTEEQTKRVGGKNRRNHAHFPEHKWPKPILENDDDGGRGGGGSEGGGAGSAKKGNGKGKEKAIDQDAVEPDVNFSSPSDSAQPSTSLDDSDEWEDEEDVAGEPIESLNLRDPVQIEMPDDKTSWAWRRRSNPLFHSQTLKAMSQTLKAMSKVTTPPPTIPTKPPPDPPLKKGAKSNKLRDFGCPFSTRRRRAESAYKEMIVRGPRRITNRRHQRALKQRFMRVDESIRSTGVVTAAAVGRTVAKLFDVLVRNRPHLLSDFKFKGYYTTNLVADVSALRAGVDEATGVVEQGEDVEKRDPMKLSIRQACDEDESSSNQKFNARDPRKRFELVLSHFVTACDRVIPARLKKVQPFERLVYAILTSPESTLKKLDGFLSALFPRHKHIGMFSQEFNRLSSQSTSLWSRLASNTSLIKPLMKLLVEYILSQRPPSYVPGETRIDWVLDISLPDDLSNTLASTFARLSTRIVTLEDPANSYRSTSQATQDNARSVLLNILRLLATFLPFAYVDYGGDAIFQSKKMIFDDDEILDAVAADDCLPSSHSIHALVTRDVGSEPCKEFWTATGGFKLAILSIAGGQKLGFGPTSFDFDAATTHCYVKTPSKQPKGTPPNSTRQLRPALYDVLRNHLDNTEKAVRFAAQRIETASSVPAPSTPSDPFERPATPSELSETPSIPPSTLPPLVSDAEEWMDVDESTDPETILRNSEFLPPRILTRFLERLINAARRATNSNLVEEFNQLVFLSSAERISFLHYARPDLKFVESLAGNPHYLLTDKIDRFGYARFIVNAKLIAQDAKYTMQFYEAILPNLNNTDRERALNNLRQEVLPLRFNWEQLGNFVPNGYTKTPASVNLSSIDPRQATSVPASHFAKPNKKKKKNSEEDQEENESKKPKPRNFIQFAEEVLHITGPYKHLKRGVIDEFIDTKTRDARGKAIYLQRPIAPFLDEKKQWTAARKVRRRKPAGPPSNVDPLVPRLLLLKYKDHDFPNRGLHDKTFETDEEEEEAKQIAQGNFELFQFRVLGETGPKVTKVLSGTDGGQYVIGSTTNYLPQTGQCVTDSLKRNNFVGRDRTSQQVRGELSTYLNEKEKDDDFRSLNPKLEHDKQKDGALTSIQEYNKVNPDHLISTSLAQPSQLSNVYNFERSLDHDRELRRVVGKQVSTLFPYKPDHTYQVTYMLSTSKLPKTGIKGRELYSVYERMWCEEVNAREDIDLVVFTMPEAFTSSHCIFCDRSVVFHPDSLETGLPLPRLTICHHCKNIFHRDNLASQLYVQSAFLAALTGIFGFSPAHEIDIFGRYIEERLSDGERRRYRRNDLELMAAYYARDYLRKQNRGFNPPQDRSNDIAQDEEDRGRVQAEIEADDAEEKLPKIRRTTKKEDPLPEIARPVGELSATEMKRMADIAENNPHLRP